MPNEKDGSKAVTKRWERVYTRIYEGRVNHSDLDLGRMRIKPPIRWILRAWVEKVVQIRMCLCTYNHYY